MKSEKFLFLIWNVPSWNIENCWNFSPTCLILRDISIHFCKNGSRTPCMWYCREFLAFTLVFYCSFLKQLSSVFIKTILIAKVEWKCSKRKFFPLLSNFFFLRVPLMKKFCKTPFFSLFSKRRIKSVFHADLSTLKFFSTKSHFLSELMPR